MWKITSKEVEDNEQEIEDLMQCEFSVQTIKGSSNGIVLWNIIYNICPFCFFNEFYLGNYLA